MTTISEHPKSGRTIKVLQITDTHLFSDSSGCLLGLNTEQSLSAIIADVRANHLQSDLILATGATRPFDPTGGAPGRDLGGRCLDVVDGELAVRIGAVDIQRRLRLWRRGPVDGVGRAGDQWRAPRPFRADPPFADDADHGRPGQHKHDRGKRQKDDPQQGPEPVASPNQIPPIAEDPGQDED